MPKPENPGSQGKGRDKQKQKGHTIDKFRKGRLVTTIQAGSDSSEPLAIDVVAQDIAIFGQVFDEAGQRLKHKPHLSVVEDEAANNAVIKASAPVSQTVQVLYKVVDAEDEDDETPPLPL